MCWEHTEFPAPVCCMKLSFNMLQIAKLDVGQSVIDPHRQVLLWGSFWSTRELPGLNRSSLHGNSHLAWGHQKEMISTGSPTYFLPTCLVY